MQSQYGPTSAGKGYEHRRPWVQKGAPQVKFRPLLLGSLGRRVGLRRALGGKEEFQNCMEGSWDHLEVLLARLGPILGRISPPWGAPGTLQEVIFGRFCDVPAEILKMSFCLLFFSHMSGLFSVLLFALCCLPCSVAGGVVHMQ